MATVYLARDPKLNRPVAIKVLRPELTDLLGRERFLREIEIAAGLQHPNILSLHDSGATDGLLYYVMPYVAGESLRDRLDREKQLPVEDALRICREIADALGCAHAQGIVHRDIKPANVLLGEGHALVADFGIARMISATDATQLTERGIAVGTPAYMSPEQSSGQDPVDGRTDLYALGCVLYEMLAGEPPFSGPTTQAVLARHRFDPVPPLRSVRPSVPTCVEDAILHALEKVPADRFATAFEFMGALEEPSATARAGPGLRRRVAWSAGVAVAGLVIYLAIRGFVSGNAGNGAGRDTTRYAVMPFDRDSGLASFNEDQLLQDALLQWTGITVVDRPSMQEELSRHGARLTSGDAEAIARRVGAGRYVLSQVSRVGDSLRVYSAVYRVTARGPPLHEGTVKLGRNLSQTGGAFSQIADRLLFGEAGPGARLDRPTGTTSRPARQAFAMALDSIYRWNLKAADSGFSLAVRYDPQFSVALLWLAQVRSWNGTPLATWRSAAERAWIFRDRLSPRDRLVSGALLAMGRDSVAWACPIWRRATALYPSDFAAWYGLATCLSDDKAVLRDATSSSGWRFRSSYHEATQAYVRAFQLLPSIHGSLAGSSYLSVRNLLWTSGDALRSGSVVPDSGLFAAYPSWQGDTLAFDPYPIEKLVTPTTTGLAVRHERELFHDIATAWVSEYPRSADALEALAISLELLGNPAALDTLRQARAVAVTAEQRIRTAGAEVWMRVKLAVPSDVQSLRIARALAESLFRAFPPGAPEPLLLASIALVTGHAALAAAYGRQPVAVAQRGVPPPLGDAALPLAVFSALGGPKDSLHALEQRVTLTIDNLLEAPLQEPARAEWLSRAATLAFPIYRFQSLPRLKGMYELLDAQVAFAEGDTVPARRMFEDLRVLRRGEPAAPRSVDAAFAEAWLLASLGDSQQAIAWLDPALAAIPAMAPEAFTDLPRAGVLVRAMVLRAELAERVGDRAGAARWARAVESLWSNADPFLKPLVQRLKHLTE